MKLLFGVGLVGSIVTALCCVGVLTPLLVATLTALDLRALTSNLDAVLLPALAVFLVLTAIGWMKRHRSNERQAPTEDTGVRP